MTPDEIIDGWWQYWLTGARLGWDAPELDRHENADNAVDEMVEEADAGIVEFLVLLAERAPSNFAGPATEDEGLLLRLSLLGAGPLEDLIRRTGEHFVNEIEEAARRSERFRLALGCVWYGEEMDASIVERLRRIAPLH